MPSRGVFRWRPRAHSTSGVLPRLSDVAWLNGKHPLDVARITPGESAEPQSSSRCTPTNSLLRLPCVGPLRSAVRQRYLLSVLTFGLAHSILVGGSPVPVAASSLAACPTKSVFSIDPSHADTALLVFNGRAWGQVVAVQDTVLSAVTVYLPPILGSQGLDMQLFVTQVDTSGFPLGDIVLTGPILDGALGDGSSPTPCTFVLDPPVALPGKRRYCFAIQEYSCSGAFMLLGDIHSTYSLGGAFNLNGCYGLGGIRNPPPYTMALCIYLQFCDGVVPAQRNTWGFLKVLYR